MYLVQNAQTFNMHTQKNLQLAKVPFELLRMTKRPHWTVEEVLGHILSDEEKQPGMDHQDTEDLGQLREVMDEPIMEGSDNEFSDLEEEGERKKNQ